MTGYLLDTGIILGFQKAKHLDALTSAAARVNLALVEEVYDEIITNAPSKHSGAATAARELIGSSRIVVHSLKVGSSVATTHEAIRAGKTSATADLGESASIAWAVHDTTVTFVTNDPAATLRALQELRGRTISFHPFLAILVEEGGLTIERCSAIAHDIQSLADWRATEPVWWTAWAAGASHSAALSR